MPISRNVTIKDVFAKDASTTIPATPVTGTSYRNKSVSTTNVKKGWPFKTIVDSSNFNEILYELSSICKAIEDYGFLPWSNLTNYVVNSVCLGSDGKIYQATQASGPSSTAKDPTSTTGYWKEFGIEKFVTLATEQTLTSSKIFKATQYIGTGSVTKGTAPASSTYYGLYFVDKNGKDWAANQLGQIQMVCDANGDNRLVLNAIKQTANSTENASIMVGIAQDGTKYTSAPVPTEDTTSSTQIDTVGARNTKLGSYALDSNVMHLTGNESAAGNKTFTGNITRKGSFTIGTLPSSTSQAQIEFDDNANTVAGSVNTQYTSGGYLETRLRVRKIGTGGFDGITVGSDPSGNIYTYAPTPNVTTATNSNQIATAGWANKTGNNIAHLDSSETITGEKTFTGTTRAEKASAGYYQTYIKNTAVTIGTAPSTNTGYQIIMNDSSGTQNGRIGALTLVYKSNGDCDTYLTAYKPVGTGQTNSTMGIRYPASGNPYGYAPTPDSATDNSTKIATTEWIHTFLTTNDADAFSTWTKAAKGGFKLANGLIVNWGRSTGSTKTVTYAIPFSSDTSFAITTAFVADREAGTHWGRINSVTSTNFKVVRDTNDTVHWIAIGY